MMNNKLLLGALLAVVGAATADFPSTFGSAGKAISLTPGETELYNHTCARGLCILRHMWFGGNWPGYDVTRLRVYTDGEKLIDGQMFLMHGIGFADDDAPWSAGTLFGKTGSPSGVFNTIQIPFNKSISITAETVSNKSERFWWIFRGTEGESSVMLGNKALPPEARLKLYTLEGAEQAPLSQIAFFNTMNNGAVLMNILSVNAQSETFLEGEVRSYAKGKPANDCSMGVCSTMGLSSGTEDYFLGTYYFNRGKYHNPVSGVTHLNHTDGEWQFAGYRLHTDDYMLFPSGGFNMTWRCGEFNGATQCRTFAYSYVYEW
eukprot:m.344284 g.344284  ORF g.344284 m.344284 type:complete len:318 (+) comp24129_c1_seq1:149-1102(+)